MSPGRSGPFCLFFSPFSAPSNSLPATQSVGTTAKHHHWGAPFRLGKKYRVHFGHVRHLTHLPTRLRPQALPPQPLDPAPNPGHPFHLPEPLCPIRQCATTFETPLLQFRFQRLQTQLLQLLCRRVVHDQLAWDSWGLPSLQPIPRRASLRLPSPCLLLRLL